jgi:hypothetical protein
MSGRRDGRRVRGFALLAVVALVGVWPALAWPADLTAWTGRYAYDEYSVTFASGAVLDLGDLGVRDAEVAILPDGTMVSRMTMASGESVVSRTKVTDVRLAGDRGSWVEHWPELGYAVRRDVERTVDGFRYSARFEDRRDRLRYGSVDRGVLRRVGPVGEAEMAAQPTPAYNESPRVPLSEEEARRLGRRIAEQIRVEPAPGPAGGPGTQAFFAESDLAEVGCRVAAGLGRYRDVSAPGIPKARVFTLTSRTGCVVELLCLIQETHGEAGLWAGLRAQAAGDARRRGYQTEERDGRLGEASELRVFSEDGAYRGFWYATESDDVLYVLRVYSEQVPVSTELERILRRKVALAAQ